METSRDGGAGPSPAVRHEQSPGLAPDLRPAACHLTLRVTGEFALPVETDLIAEAHLLCERLSEN